MERCNATIHSSSITVIGVLLSGSLSNALHKEEKHGHSANSVTEHSPFFCSFLRRKQREKRKRL